MRKLSMKLFDSFTDHIFGGNTAGVVTAAEHVSQDEMQNIAAEINAPTTGFVSTRGKNEFEVKFFTPTQEIDMCGHAVIAVFMGLEDEGKLESKNFGRVDVKLYTKAGLIPVEVYYENGKPTHVMMTQNKPSFREVTVRKAEIAKLLGISEVLIEADHPMEIVSTALRHLFVPVKSLEVMKQLRPDFQALAELSRKLGVENNQCIYIGNSKPGFSCSQQRLLSWDWESGGSGLRHNEQRPGLLLDQERFTGSQRKWYSDNHN